MLSSVSRTCFRYFGTVSVLRQAAPVGVLHCPVDTADPQFVANQQHMQEAVRELDDIEAELRKGGPPKAVARHKKRGRLTVRERVALLFDTDTKFLELSKLAGYNADPEPVAGGGLVTGIGKVNGTECMVVANDPTCKGGTYFESTLRKHLRAQEIAWQNRLPTIYLVDSGGGYLPGQAKGFADRDMFGRVFYNQANMSADGIPQLSAVMGSCTAGGAYIPAMSDESVIVKGRGTIFLGGPPLVKAATGEIVTAEELGGADVHTRLSGVADHMADTEEHAMELIRRIVDDLNWVKDPAVAWRAEEPPLHDAAELDGLAPCTDDQQPDMRAIIARIVDGSRFGEFKARYGTSLLTGFSRLGGCPIAVLANNGPLDAEAARKGAHFLELCAQRRTPVLFLQNVKSFAGGDAKDPWPVTTAGAKLLTAVANTGVPKLTVVVGTSYGLGNYGMGGRVNSPRLLFMWPTAKIGAMDPTQAADVVTMLESRDRVPDGRDTEAWQAAHQKFEEQSSALYSTARLWDDGVIRPSETRDVLKAALSAALGSPGHGGRFGVFRM